MSTFTDEQLAYMQAHINDTRVPDIYWIYISAIVSAVSSTVLRVLAKKYTRNGISLDDYFVILATVCIIGECIINFFTGVPNGYGRHIIFVKSNKDLETILKGEFVFTEFNTWAVFFVKLAILAFYYRVFPNSTFHRVVMGTITFMFIWQICTWSVNTFGCWPVQKWWVSDIPGHCVNLVPFAITANVFNILTDFFIFLMPTPLLWKLRISVWRRLLLCGVFSLGLATCVLSVIRVVTVFHVNSADFTWDNIPIAAYYVFEPVGGLICINIPFIARAILRKMKGVEATPASDFPNPYDDKPSNSEQKRRHSRWLHGIDSIQLTNLSSRISKRRSLASGMGINQRPWISITPTFSDIDLTSRNGAGVNEVVVQRPEFLFFRDEMPIGDRDLEANAAGRIVIRAS